MAGERVSVDCREEGDGWLCRVVVADSRSETSHEVTVSRDALSRYGSAGEEAERFVERSFRFLLEREPKESIVRRFAISEIERYFGEYATAIRRGS